MEHLVTRLKVGSVLLTNLAAQVSIWVFLTPLSVWLAAACSLTWALAFTKFFTTGPNINFITPWWVRNDDMHFVNCVLAGVNPGAIRRAYRFLPSDPRCRFCLIPFGGFGKLLHITPSRKNPNFCMSCIEYAPIGVYDMEVGVLFADIRGYTSWAEQHRPDEAAERLATFRRVANRSFTKEDVFVEFVGDQIMVLYFTAFPSLAEQTPQLMLAGAHRFHRALRSEFSRDDLAVGIGIHMGTASVGNVGDTYAKDFTAAGDVINTGARLQSCAGPDEIVISDDTYRRMGADAPGAKSMEFSVKGKSEPLRAFVLAAGVP